MRAEHQCALLQCTGLSVAAAACKCLNLFQQPYPCNHWLGTPTKHFIALTQLFGLLRLGPSKLAGSRLCIGWVLVCSSAAGFHLETSGPFSCPPLTQVAPLGRAKIWIKLNQFRLELEEEVPHFLASTSSLCKLD